MSRAMARRSAMIDERIARRSRCERDAADRRSSGSRSGLRRRARARAPQGLPWVDEHHALGAPSRFRRWMSSTTPAIVTRSDALLTTVSVAPTALPSGKVVLGVRPAHEHGGSCGLALVVEPGARDEPRTQARADSRGSRCASGCAAAGSCVSRLLAISAPVMPSGIEATP